MRKTTVVPSVLLQKLRRWPLLDAVVLDGYGRRARQFCLPVLRLEAESESERRERVAAHLEEGGALILLEKVRDEGHACLPPAKLHMVTVLL